MPAIWEPPQTVPLSGTYRVVHRNAPSSPPFALELVRGEVFPPLLPGECGYVLIEAHAVEREEERRWAA